MFPEFHFAIVECMNEQLRKLLQDSAAALGVALDGRALDLFDRYYRELLIWNEKMNLISIRTPEELLIKHFIDSLTPLPFIARPQGSLLDIGTGGGFPGIPMKIAMPALQVFLLEASRKKSSFLRHLVRQLSLAQTTVIHARAELALTDDAYRHAFDTVISRAAFKLPELLKTGLFFLSPGGLLIALKGPSGEEEMEIINDLDVRCIACHDIRLPFDGGRRIIMLFQADR